MKGVVLDVDPNGANRVHGSEAITREHIVSCLFWVLGVRHKAYPNANEAGTLKDATLRRDRSVSSGVSKCHPRR